MDELVVTSLHDKVYELMAQLPNDKVTTYGDLAAMSGRPYAARIVGGIAHNGALDLPWHRLVNAKGGLAVRSLPARDRILSRALLPWLCFPDLRSHSVF